MIAGYSDGGQIALEIGMRHPDLAGTFRRSGNQHFEFIGRAAISGAAGELRFAGRTLAGDVDGDGIADFRVEVVSDARLEVTDLLKPGLHRKPG
jgi:serralysin